MLAAANNTFSTLAQTLATADTSILLTDGTGFPTKGVVVVAGNANPDINEVIYYGGRTGNSLTSCVRGFDGTTAETHTIGSLVACALIAKHITDLQPKHGTSAQRASLALTLTVDDTGRRYYDLDEDRLYEWVGNRWEAGVIYVGRAIRDYVDTAANVLPLFYRKGDRWTEIDSNIAVIRVCRTDTITHSLADWIPIGRQG